LFWGIKRILSFIRTGKPLGRLFGGLRHFLKEYCGKISEK
jgi:hypothetical protein